MCTYYVIVVISMRSQCLLNFNDCCQSNAGKRCLRNASRMHAINQILNANSRMSSIYYIRHWNEWIDCLANGMSSCSIYLVSMYFMWIVCIAFSWFAYILVRYAKICIFPAHEPFMEIFSFCGLTSIALLYFAGYPYFVTWTDLCCNLQAGRHVTAYLCVSHWKITAS